jgi:hypothetical protein
MRLRRTAALSLAVLTMTGCAERRLVAAPREAPSTATWTAVWAAGIVAAVVLGVLLTLPAWRVRGGARVAVTLLTIQSGAVVVSGMVLGSAAVRSWQLIEAPPDEPATALLRLSRVDGDTAFFALVVLLLVIGAGLLATITATSARFAAGADRVERWLASAVLAVQLGVSAYALVRLVAGADGWLYLAGAVSFPVIAIALATCWPPRQRA